MDIFTSKDEELINEIVTKDGEDYIIIEGKEEKVWSDFAYFSNVWNTTFTIAFADRSDPRLELRLGNAAGLPAPLKTEKEAKEALNRWRNLYKYQDFECDIHNGLAHPEPSIITLHHPDATGRAFHYASIRKSIPLPKIVAPPETVHTDLTLHIKYHDGSEYKFGIGSMYGNSDLLKTFFLGQSDHINLAGYKRGRPVVPDYGIDLLSYNVGFDYPNRVRMKLACEYNRPGLEKSKIKDFLGAKQKIIKHNTREAGKVTYRVTMNLMDSGKSIKQLLVYDDYNEYAAFKNASLDLDYTRDSFPLVKKVTVKAAESKTKVSIPFGHLNNDWLRMKNAIEDGDELWYFSTSKESWEQHCGHSGYVLLRGDIVVDSILTEMN